MYTRIMFCLCAVLIALVATATALAGVPSLINYQGRLLDAVGNPVTTPVSIIYAIWSDSTAGDLLWTEQQQVTPDANGMFSCMLGSITPVPDSAFPDKRACIGIKVGADPEMSPRVRLASMPYAFYAHGVHGDIQTEPGSLTIVNPGDTIRLTAGSGGAKIRMVGISYLPDAPDTFEVSVGSGKAALALFDGAGYHSALTSKSLVMGHPAGSQLDSLTVIDSAGNARFAGDVTIGWHGKDSLTYMRLTSDADSGKAEIKIVATDNAVNKDSCTFTAGSGKAALALFDGAGNHSELTSKSLSLLMPGDVITSVDPTGIIIRVHDTTKVKMDSDGNAHFSGDVTSGNSLKLQGNLYRLVTSNGKIYFGRATPGVFSDVQVGIGTESPSATLHVEGTTYLNGVATIASGARVQSAANGGARILGEQGGTKEKPAIGFFSTNGVDDGGGGNGIYRPSANAMAFAVQSSERMRITGWGVGIGSPPPTTPTALLHVDGPISTAITTVTGNTTLTGYNSVVLGNNSFATGAITVTLPAANTCAGRQYTVKKISPLANGAVSVQRSGTDLIDGVSTQALNNQFDFFVLVSDGVSNWYIVGK